MSGSEYKCRQQTKKLSTRLGDLSCTHIKEFNYASFWFLFPLLLLILLFFFFFCLFQSPFTGSVYSLSLSLSLAMILKKSFLRVWDFSKKFRCGRFFLGSRLASSLAWVSIGSELEMGGGAGDGRWATGRRKLP